MASFRFLLPLLVLLCAAPPAHAADFVEGEVGGVTDGASILLLNRPNRKECRIRLLGVVAPERGRALLDA